MEVGERERPLVGRVLALEPRQRVAVGERIATRLVREEEFPAEPVGRRQLMIHVGRELILFEGRRDDRGHLAAFEQLRAIPAAVEPAVARGDEVGAVGELGLQQLPRDGVDDVEVDRPMPRGPDGGGEGVDARVGAIVGERSRQEHGIARLVYERGVRLRPLVRAEEERLVPDDRAANRAAALMAIEDRLLDPGAVEEEIVGHQRVVLVVVVDAAAEAVGAAFAHEREVAAAVPPRACVVEARLQLDFLERLGRRRHVAGERTAAVVDRPARSVDTAVAAQEIGDVDAIEHEAVVRRARAVHARGDRRVVVRQQLADVGRDARLDDQQLREVPGRRRQRIELFLIERALDGHRTGRHHSRVRDDVDGLGQRADLERDIDRRHLRGRHGDAFSPQRFEPGQLEGHAKRAGREEAGFPVAAGVRRDRSYASGVDVRERDRHAGNGGPARIGHLSEQPGARPCLGADWTNQEHKE